MGLEFRTEQERNPINVPSIPPIDPCAEMKEEFQMMNNFLEDNGYAIVYENYKVAVRLREEMAKAALTNDGFEEVN